MEAGRFRFGMKSLFVATTMLCILLAMIAKPIMERRSQQALLDRVVAVGGKLSNRSFIQREFSPGRFLLSIADSSYNLTFLYGVDLNGAKVSDADLDWIVRLRYIKELKLANTQVTDAGVDQLRSLEYLSSLDLGGTRVTDRGVAALSNLRDLSSLRVINTAVTDEALAKLDATLPYAHFCEERAIEKLKAAGIQVVAFPRHVEGDMSRGNFVIRAGDEAIDADVMTTILSSDNVRQLSHLQSLRKLHFRSVTMWPHGLTGLRPLAKMTSFEIYSTALTDKDLEAISRQTQLEKLTFYDCAGMTDEGLLHLRSLKNLKELVVDGCKGTTPAGKAALKSELPNLKSLPEN